MSPIGKPAKKPAEPQRPPEEEKFIRDMERMEGRKLTEQEINLSIEQAKALGEL